MTNSVNEIDENIDTIVSVDYGDLSPIKGRWVQWYEWDRPKDLYPTNHINIELKTSSDMNNEESILKFKERFYQLASTVLYIHNISFSYTFGDTSSGGSLSQENDILFGIMSAPHYNTNEYSFTCDPNIQPNRVVRVNITPSSIIPTIEVIKKVNHEWIVDSEYIQEGNKIIVPSGKTIRWTINDPEYGYETGMYTVIKDKTINVSLIENNI